jgi:hypothetical protein
MIEHPLESLSALLDGELADAERRGVESHVAGCPSCARHLRDLTAVDAMARGLPPVAVPDGYLEALPARVRARIRAERSPVRRAAWVWPLAAGFALAVLTPLVLREGRPRHSPPVASDRVATAPTLDPSPVLEAEERAAKPPSELAAGPQPTQAQRYATRQSNAPAPAAAARPRVAEEAKSASAREVTGGQRGQERDDRSSAVASSVSELERAPVAAGPARTGALAGAAAQAADAGAMRDEAVAETSTFAGEPDAPAAPSLMRKSTRAEAGPSNAEDRAFRTVAALPLSSADAARRARQGWARFLADHPNGARADEARVRQVEAAVAAFVASADPSDRALAEQDAAAYLSKGNAPQAARVKAALGRLDIGNDR